MPLPLFRFTLSFIVFFRTRKSCFHNEAPICDVPSALFPLAGPELRLHLLLVRIQQQQQALVPYIIRHIQTPVWYCISGAFPGCYFYIKSCTVRRTRRLGPPAEPLELTRQPAG